MSAPSGAARRLLRDDEINYLTYGLRLEMSARLQKRTLQRLCEWYEEGRLLSEPTPVRQLIHSLMASSEILVRRWAIKALALIGHPDDFQRLIDRLRVEEDSEAQTWGITGLIKNAEDRGLKAICDMAGLENSSAITLAARLYAPNSWIAAQSDHPRISLDTDELTLKWATFLIGYGKAPEDLFHPHFSNEIFLGELNAHDSPDISEYSIWGLWVRPEFGAGYSKIPLSDAKKHPESVRKWLYRLGTKSPEAVGLDKDALSDLRRDSSARAREGLATGIADLEAAAFGMEVLDWYSAEPDEQVRENLLASMASRSGESADYSDAVEQKFADSAPDSLLRRRLLVASSGNALYARLKRIDVAEARAKQGLLEYGAGPVVMGDMYMNSPSLKVGGDLISQNVSVGDMIGSANAAVQNLQQNDRATAAVLEQVLALLSSAAAADGAKEIADAVKEVAQAPSPENKRTLVERLKSFGAKASAAGSAIGGIDKVIEAVQAITS